MTFIISNSASLGVDGICEVTSELKTSVFWWELRLESNNLLCVPSSLRLHFQLTNLPVIPNISQFHGWYHSCAIVFSVRGSNNLAEVFKQVNWSFQWSQISIQFHAVKRNWRPWNSLLEVKHGLHILSSYEMVSPNAYLLTIIIIHSVRMLPYHPFGSRKNHMEME